MARAAETGTVEVLLATRDGEPFLAAQLDSLLAQTFQAFTVLVSDDGSSDATRAILARYAARFPGRFRLLPPVPHRLGACGNFARLIEAATADHAFFCDQDDVWLPDKMAGSLARMAQLAADHPPGTPLLVHTDLTVVDADLAVLGRSFYRYTGIDPARNSLGALLHANIAPGCATLVNRALYQVARPVPAEVLMYDHWMAQVAAALGAIAFVDRPTVLYRQHAGNAVGTRRKGVGDVLTRARHILFGDETLRVLTSFSRHAAILVERYGNRMSPAHRAQARALAELWQVPPWQRFARLLRAGLRKPTVAANLGLALLVLRTAAPVRPGGDR